MLERPIGNLEDRDDANVTHTLDLELLHYRVDAEAEVERQRLELLEDRVQALLGIDRECDNHIIDPSHAGEAEKIITGAQYADAMDGLRDSRFAVVEDAANDKALVLRLLHLGGQPLTLITGPEDHDISGKKAGSTCALRCDL